MNKTLSIIKPDAVEKNLVDDINNMIQQNNLTIIAQKKLKLSKKQAEQFYLVHKNRPFFDSLTDFMSSGEIVVQVLQGKNVVETYRKLMGATNPDEAEKDTIRKKYALSIEKNAVHGSDATETAEKEIQFFFSELELMQNI